MSGPRACATPLRVVKIRVGAPSSHRGCSCAVGLAPGRGVTWADRPLQSTAATCTLHRPAWGQTWLASPFSPTPNPRTWTSLPPIPVPLVQGARSAGVTRPAAPVQPVASARPGLSTAPARGQVLRKYLLTLFWTQLRFLSQSYWGRCQKSPGTFPVCCPHRTQSTA